MYRDGTGVEPDLDKAIGMFRMAADQGNVPAAVSLLAIVHPGTHEHKGVIPAVIKKLKAQANGGNIGAIRTLGNVFLDGTGVEKDPSQALEWFLKGSELGDTFCIVKCGEINNDRHNIEKCERAD